MGRNNHWKMQTTFFNTSLTNKMMYFYCFFKSRKHLSQPKLVSTSAEMEKAILNNNNGITVLMITGKEHFHFMKNIMKKVYKYIRIW